MTIFFKIDWIDFVGHVKYFLDDFHGCRWTLSVAVPLIIWMVQITGRVMMIQTIHRQDLVADLIDLDTLVDVTRLKEFKSVGWQMYQVT